MLRWHRFGSHCGTVSVAAGGNRLRILDIKSDLDLAPSAERPAYIFGTATYEIYTKLRIRNMGLRQTRWRTKGRGVFIAR